MTTAEMQQRGITYTPPRIEQPMAPPRRPIGARYRRPVYQQQPEAAREGQLRRVSPQMRRAAQEQAQREGFDLATPGGKRAVQRIYQGVREKFRAGARTEEKAAKAAEAEARRPRTPAEKKIEADLALRHARWEQEQEQAAAAAPGELQNLIARTLAMDEARNLGDARRAATAAREALQLYQDIQSGETPSIPLEPTNEFDRRRLQRWEGVAGRLADGGLSDQEAVALADIAKRLFGTPADIAARIQHQEEVQRRREEAERAEKTEDIERQAAEKTEDLGRKQHQRTQDLKRKGQVLFLGDKLKDKDDQIKDLKNKILGQKNDIKNPPEGANPEQLGKDLQASEAQLLTLEEERSALREQRGQWQRGEFDEPLPAAASEPREAGAAQGAGAAQPAQLPADPVAAATQLVQGGASPEQAIRQLEAQGALSKDDVDALSKWLIAQLSEKKTD